VNCIAVAPLAPGWAAMIRVLVIVPRPRRSHWPVMVPVLSSARNADPLAELEFGGTVFAPLNCAYSRHEPVSGVELARGRGVMVCVGVLVAVGLAVAVLVKVLDAVAEVVGVSVAVALGAGVAVAELVAVGVGVGPVDCATTIGGGSNWRSNPRTIKARATLCALVHHAETGIARI
jgi:hypothetical protein